MSIAIAGPHARSEETTLPGVNLAAVAALAHPFALGDLEWKVQSCGPKKGGGVWARVAPYVTNRAIAERLDDALGPANWQNIYLPAPVQGDGMMCGIGINIGGTWIWKYDGSGSVSESRGIGSADAMKGTFSNAMKRAAVQWGIGRPLYYLDTLFAHIIPESDERYDDALSGMVKGKDGAPGTLFKWLPPLEKIPQWCLPGGSGRPGMASQPQQTTRPVPAASAPAPAPATRTPAPIPTPAAAPSPNKAERASSPAAAYEGPAPDECPKCGGAMWDNRQKKKRGTFKPNAPDFTCKDKDTCGHQLWPGMWPPKAGADVGDGPGDDDWPRDEDDDLPF